jgi:hypothetical protein
MAQIGDCLEGKLADLVVGQGVDLRHGCDCRWGRASECRAWGSSVAVDCRRGASGKLKLSMLAEIELSCSYADLGQGCTDAGYG